MEKENKIIKGGSNLLKYEKRNEQLWCCRRKRKPRIRRKNSINKGIITYEIDYLFWLILGFYNRDNNR